MNNEQLTQANAQQEVSGSGANFDELVRQMHATFEARKVLYGPAIFATKTKGLSTVYRKAFPEAEQKHHTCTCCRNFMERHGGMVFITPEGNTISAIWDSSIAPEEYKASVAAAEKLVARQSVDSRYYTEHAQWGIARNEVHDEAGNLKAVWTHFTAPVDEDCVRLAHTLPRFIGDSKTSFDLLLKATQEFSIVVAGTALHHVTAAGKHLERWVPQLAWLHGFLKTLEGKSVGQIRNLVHLEVSKVSPSFAGIANNVEGNVLLAGIAEGRNIDFVMKQFITRVDPEFYRRTTAAPTEGNVKVAQQRFEELGLGGADLMRRMASVEELRSWWTPKAPEVKEAPKAELFADLATKQSEAKPEVKQTIANGGTMSWEKFKEKVLPTALSFQVAMNASEKYIYYTNSVSPDAGRLWFYDKEEDRNTLSWHTTGNPMPASHFGYRVGEFVDVLAISDVPAVWTGGERGKRYSIDCLLLNGMVDGRTDATSALFPELLRAELKEVERVVEAHGNKQPLDITTPRQAIGVQGGVARRVRVRTELGLTDYTVDRLE